MSTLPGKSTISLSSLRAYERGSSSHSYTKFELALFALLVALLMIALGVGASMYRSISEQRWADDQTRTGLALIANSVHITDTTDAIGVGAAPEGQALVLTERFADGAFETRIYLHDGNVVEEYARAGAPYTPERATQLVESNTFSFSYQGGLLSIHTDQGTQEILLHSVRHNPAPSSETEGGGQRES